jgi:hypothetical protein
VGQVLQKYHLAYFKNKNGAEAPFLILKQI